MSDLDYSLKLRERADLTEFAKAVAAETCEHIFDDLITNGVMRIDALGSLVFVNCNTLQVEYLPKNIFGVDGL